MVFENLVSFLTRNAVWVMIVAVVAISSFSKYRVKELKVHQDVRTREMEHEREMKGLEADLENAKARRIGAGAA